ncbi:MAG: cupin domain-containing protein [Pseudomonadales bacterium]
MDIRADLSKPAQVRRSEWQWVDSPQAGVRRVMLDRVGDEVAVATSFVRYDPASRFPGHDHALGEEFVVLEGEFGDEHGRYPPGSYIRNPPGSHHVPFSDPGCLIWVKLRQFQTDDLAELRTRLDLPIPASGCKRRTLHRFGTEDVAEITAAAGARIKLPAAAVCQEVLVLEGEVRTDAGEVLDLHAWLRRPAGSGIALQAVTPCRLLWKTRPAG